MKLYTLGLDVKTTFTLTIPSGSQHIIVATGGGQRCWIGYVVANSSGAVSVIEIATGSVFDSYNTATNAITITWKNSGTTSIFDMCLLGNPISDGT